MRRKRYTAEQIISILREVDVKLSQGKNVGQVTSLVGTLWYTQRGLDK